MKVDVPVDVAGMSGVHLSLTPTGQAVDMELDGISKPPVQAVKENQALIRTRIAPYSSRH